MSKRIIQLIVGAFVLLVFASLAFGAAADKDKGAGVATTSSIDDYKAFTINNIFNYYSNNGDGSYNKFTSNGALEFPKGTAKTAIFEDGIVWGGFHKGIALPKVGGSVYRHALQAGPIITPGGPNEADRAVAADPLSATYRVYRIRPDVTPTTPFAEVQSVLTDEANLVGRYEAGTTAQKLFDAYIKDWNEWPAKTAANPVGLAPFKDVNGNGVYDPGTDIPGQPGADQTMYYVSNDLNASLTVNLAGCNPIGLEVHRTFWGYNRQGALGNTIFGSTLVINKSGAPIDSMFMVQWSDPDLGDSGDDYAGCDVGRSFGFIYNGRPNDATYGKEVPCSGYDFFQGPIVPGLPSDSAVFQLQYRHGFKNLGMSTFVFFINGSTTYGDPAQGSGGNTGWYYLMNARVAATGAEFINPLTHQPTKFTLDGDPVTGQGWLDGMEGLTPGDRRICLVTGPFNMANGDTQELVVATLVGLGGDRISSIAVAKWYSDLAQFAYNSLFNIANPPPAPRVSVAPLNGEVSLNWGDPTYYTPLEATNSGGYLFEGYNVYQMAQPAFDKNTAIHLATYDLINAITTVFDDVYDDATGYVLKKPVQFGTDSGIKRTYQTTNDAIKSTNLVNGTTYYFAVTSYSVNPDPLAKPTNLESSPQVLTVVPQTPIPGTVVAPAGDTLAVTQTALPGGSMSEGETIPIVVDPYKATGHQYKVTFHNVKELDENGDTVDVTLWDLKDVTANKVLLKDQRNQTGDEDYAVVDGLFVKVTGPANAGMREWSIPSGTRRFSPVGGYTGLGLEGFSTAGDPTAYDPANGTMGMAGHFAFGGIGTTLKPADYHNVLLKLAVVDNVGKWDPKATPADANYSRAYRYLRAAGSAPAKPEFAPWIINTASGYPYQDYGYAVPFSAWDMETTPPTRLAVGSFENNVTAGDVDGRYWPGTTDVANSGRREFAFIFKSPYTGDTPDPSLQVNMSGNTSTPLMWVMTCARRAEVAWAAGDQFEIFASHQNTPFTEFAFTAPVPVKVDPTQAAADVDKLNVYPNPYIGFNPLEANKYQRFVTFTHLPSHAVLRVFNLAGILIRTMEKNDPGQFLQWDLRNESGFPVSSGMYVVYVDMPELGKTKILKLGVIPEQQFIDRW
jgi:hypothetical protein